MLLCKKKGPLLCIYIKVRGLCLEDTKCKVNIKGLKYNGGSLTGTFPVPKDGSPKDKQKSIYVVTVYMHIDGDVK